MNKALDDPLTRTAAWPKSAQEELAQMVREIDVELRAGAYVATADELAGIARGLEDSAAGRFAGDDRVEAIFAKQRR